MKQLPLLTNVAQTFLYHQLEEATQLLLRLYRPSGVVPSPHWRDDVIHLAKRCLAKYKAEIHNTVQIEYLQDSESVELAVKRLKDGWVLRYLFSGDTYTDENGVLVLDGPFPPIIGAKVDRFVGETDALGRLALAMWIQTVVRWEGV